MIITQDQDIVKETAQFSQDYAVAEQICRLIKNERFKIFDIADYEAEFDISLIYNVHGYGHLAHDFNRFLENCIRQMKLPDDLYMNYDYTAYVDPTSKTGEIKRSGYVVEIQDPEHVDHISWDSVMSTNHDFYLKFRITGERIFNCSDLYDGMFKLRIPLRDQGSQGSVRRVVDILKEMINSSM